jgi:peroxiredoxin
MDSYQETAGLRAETLQRNSRSTAAALTVALVLSVIVNVLLTHRVRSLTDALSARIAGVQLKIGTTVPPITARRLDSQQEVIAYQSTNQPTVLYIFTPPCAWCARNMDNFKTLLDKEGGHYRFIALSLSDEGLAQYVAKNKLKTPIYSDLSTEVKKAYKLSGTPQTIVVSPEGRVLQTWMGAYVGDQKSQVEAFFHLSLPGLRTEADKVSRSSAAPAE